MQGGISFYVPGVDGPVKGLITTYDDSAEGQAISTNFSKVHEAVAETNSRRAKGESAHSAREDIQEMLKYVQ